MDYYCPKCKSTKPMVKAGKAVRVNGNRVTHKQSWKCRNKRCKFVTVNPLKER